jgi:transposase-like protein
MENGVMGLTGRKFTREFKEAAVRRLELGASMAEVARACEVSPNILQRWRRELRECGAKAFTGPGRSRADEDRIAALESKVGRQAVEIRFFAGMLGACRGAAEAAGIDYPRLVYPCVEKQMSLAIPIPLNELCRLAGVSRAGFYRWRSVPLEIDAVMELRDEIQRIALEFSYYGRRRVTRELHDRGFSVNRKKVQRLMREDNLLCLRKRKFAVATTDSKHGLRIYPNLAAKMTLTGANQLWRANIIYIRLQEEFVYLAVVLDAWSRKVVGWALERRMEDELTLAALRMAIGGRGAAAGLVHHSDRGSQYASGDYTSLLDERGIRMSRKANPWDNAQCESFMKTLKYEDV